MVRMKEWSKVIYFGFLLISSIYVLNGYWGFLFWTLFLYHINIYHRFVNSFDVKMEIWFLGKTPKINSYKTKSWFTKQPLKNNQNYLAQNTIKILNCVVNTFNLKFVANFGWEFWLATLSCIQMRSGAGKVDILIWGQSNKMAPPGE